MIFILRAVFALVLLTFLIFFSIYKYVNYFKLVTIKPKTISIVKSPRPFNVRKEQSFQDTFIQIVFLRVKNLQRAHESQLSLTNTVARAVRWQYYLRQNWEFAAFIKEKTSNKGMILNCKEPRPRLTIR